MPDLTTDDLTLAAMRAQARQALNGVLAKFPELPHKDRRAVLLDLAMEPAAHEPQHSTAAPEPRPTHARTARRGRPVRRGKTSGHAAAPDEGRTDTLLATLKPAPGMPVTQLAAVVYPDVDTKSGRGRTRSLLTSLKKQGRVRNPSAGRWEVVAT